MKKRQHATIGIMYYHKLHLLSLVLQWVHMVSYGPFSLSLSTHCQEACGSSFVPNTSICMFSRVMSGTEQKNSISHFLPWIS
jgi:hypothetical protein